MRFWNFVENEEELELRIDGDIIDDDDAWIYEWFDMQATSPNAFKEALSAHEGKDITVWVDSYGGSVFAAAGIYNALKEHKGKVTVKIDGKAMSAASVIAMAGEEILMSPMAVMMIHNPWTMAQGDMRDLRKTADVLDTIKESIVNAYALKTGRSQDEIASMMDDETWMSANVAVREGFADEMLYNSPDEVMNAKGFDFNRLNVLNHTNKAIEKVMQFEKKDTKLHEARLRFLRMKGDRND